MHRLIKFNQKACLKPFIFINTELEENAKKKKKNKNEFKMTFHADE